jgi:general secretion pathway protein E
LLFPNLDETASKDILLYRASGCPHCNGSGYLGRIGVFELLIMTDELRAFINSTNVFRDIVNAPKPPSYYSLRDGGLALVRQGLTTVEEVFRVTVE